MLIGILLIGICVLLLFEYKRNELDRKFKGRLLAALDDLRTLVIKEEPVLDSCLPRLQLRMELLRDYPITTALLFALTDALDNVIAVTKKFPDLIGRLTMEVL